MRSLILFLTTILTYQVVAAQGPVASMGVSGERPARDHPITNSTEDSIKATVNKLFTAMRTGDRQLFLDAMGDSALLQTISRDKNGKTVVLTESVAEFADLVATLKKDSADERIVFDLIKVDGPMAVVWTPYQFHLNGKFSHCGVNNFTLVRIDEVWKIQYIIDTRRKTNCK